MFLLLHAATWVSSVQDSAEFGRVPQLLRRQFLPHSSTLPDPVGCLGSALVRHSRSGSVLGAIPQPTEPTFASLQLQPKGSDPSALCSSVPRDQRIVERRAGKAFSSLPRSTLSSVV